MQYPVSRRFRTIHLAAFARVLPLGLQSGVLSIELAYVDGTKVWSDAHNAKRVSYAVCTAQGRRGESCHCSGGEIEFCPAAVSYAFWMVKGLARRPQYSGLMRLMKPLRNVSRSCPSLTRAAFPRRTLNLG